VWECVRGKHWIGEGAHQVPLLHDVFEPSRLDSDNLAARLCGFSCWACGEWDVVLVERNVWHGLQHLPRNPPASCAYTISIVHLRHVRTPSASSKCACVMCLHPASQHHRVLSGRAAHILSLLVTTCRRGKQSICFHPDTHDASMSRSFLAKDALRMASVASHMHGGLWMPARPWFMPMESDACPPTDF
jgi:hypothetical protein